MDVFQNRQEAEWANNWKSIEFDTDITIDTDTMNVIETKTSMQRKENISIENINALDLECDVFVMSIEKKQ